MHKFDFRLLTDETPNKWRSLAFKELRQEVRETHVFGTSRMFSPDFNHSMRVNCLSRTQQKRVPSGHCIILHIWFIYV